MRETKDVKRKIGNGSGITLIALVITIIVLLILAGISINLIRENGGVIEKSEIAVNETEKQSVKEKIDFKINSEIIDFYEKNNRKPTLEELSEVLRKEEEIEWMEMKIENVAVLKIAEYP